MKKNKKHFSAFLLVVAILVSVVSSAQSDLSSIFTISGWTPGSTTPLSRSYNGTLTTSISLSGVPNNCCAHGGFNSDMVTNFTYNIYLTPVGGGTSILIGTHTVWAENDYYYSVGNNPYYTLVSIDGSTSTVTGVGTPVTVGTAPNTATGYPSYILTTTDAVANCVPAGSYQVDIEIAGAFYSYGLVTTYCDFQWEGYANNSATLSAFGNTNYGSYNTLGSSSYTLAKVALVNVSTSLSVSVPSSVHVCPNGKGTLTATPGATSGCGLTYLWSDPAHQTSATAINLNPGTYTVTVTGPSGATATASGTVTTGAVATAITSSSTNGCVGAPLTLTATTSGGTTPYSYSWSTGTPSANTDVITPTSTGTPTYIVTVTDGNGCTITASKSLTVYTPPTISVSPNPVTLAFCTLSVTLTASGGTSYLWSNGSSTSTTSLCYTRCPWYAYISVTGSDAHGCSSVVTVPVNYITPCRNGKSAEIEMEQPVSFNFYPNPTERILNISLEGDAIADAQIFLTDITGRKVLERKYDVVPGFVASLDVSGLTRGEYIATIKMDGKTYFNKVSIQ